MDSENGLITKEMINKYSSIRFSDSVLSGDSPGTCDITQAEYSCSIKDGHTDKIDPSLKDHTPEEISFWINFGYFRK